MNPINNKRHAFISLFLLVLFILGFALVVILPAVSTNKRHNEHIDALILKRQHLLSVKEEAELVEKQISALQGEKNYKENLFKGQSVAVAEADLQNRIETLIELNDGTLISTQTVHSSKKELFQDITIHVRMSGSMEALRSVLYELERAKPLLFIENIKIENSRTSSKNRVTPLRITFDVVGYMDKVIS